MTRPHTPNKVYEAQLVDCLAALVFCFELGFGLALFILWSRAQ